MSRKAKIVVAITMMIACMVIAFSAIYISQLLRQRLTTSYETASLLTRQLADAANNAVPDLTSTRVDTNDPAAVRRALAEYLENDVNVNTMLDSAVANWPTIFDATIVDSDGKVILSNNPDLVTKPVTSVRPDLRELRDAHFWDQLQLIYSPSKIYDVSLPLELDGAPFGSVHLGVSTVLLKNELTPRLQHAAFFSAVAIVLSLFLAAGVSNLALGPLRQLNLDIDTVSRGEAELLPGEEDGQDEFGLVSLKIAHLGRQIRDTNQIFSALKDNVEQVMSKLQDGLMLFTRDLRVVLVSASAERFLGRARRDILGKTASEIFSGNSPVNQIVLKAFDEHQPLSQREVQVSDQRTMQVSLDFIQERGTPIGALLTMRDAESVRRIEDEIELSRRLSAGARTTRSVAHEVKNPINAIVLHLQLLQNKLSQVDPDTRRHMDIIGNEIHRLDRVVQILVDFTRPRDLRLEELDLNRLVEDVGLLAMPDAGQRGITIDTQLAQDPLIVKADADFMKQAFLNVVLNGIQAMPDGGHLKITVHREDDDVVTEIRDQGAGISPEVREKIFELYFTTKKGGSGIGLAQTYQIMQWHYGSVDFDSTPGEGTTFRLRMPLIGSRPDVSKELATRQ